MAKKFKDFIAHEPVHHKTSIGRKPSLCKMNKRKRKILRLTKAKENNEIFIDGIYLLGSERDCMPPHKIIQKHLTVIMTVSVIMKC